MFLEKRGDGDQSLNKSVQNALSLNFQVLIVSFTEVEALQGEKRELLVSKLCPSRQSIL